MKKKMIIPCVRGVQGDWVYYSAVMDAKQISDWVEAAKDIKVAKSLLKFKRESLGTIYDKGLSIICIEPEGENVDFTGN